MNYSAIYQGENRRVLLVNARTLNMEPIYLIDGRLVQFYGPDSVKFVHESLGVIRGFWVEISRYARLPRNIKSYLGKMRGFEENVQTFKVDNADALLEAVVSREQMKIISIFTDLKVLNSCGGMVHRLHLKKLKEDILDQVYVRYTSGDCFQNNALSGYPMVFHHGGEPRAEFFTRPTTTRSLRPILCQGIKDGDYIVVGVRANGQQGDEYEEVGFSRFYHYKIAQMRYGEIVPLRRTLALEKRVALLRRITRNIPPDFIIETLQENFNYIKNKVEGWDHPERMWEKYMPNAISNNKATAYPTSTKLEHLSDYGLIDTSTLFDEKVDLDEPVDPALISATIKGRIVEVANARIVSRLGNIPGYGQFLPSLGVTVALYHDSQDDRVRNTFAKALNLWVNEGTMHRAFDGLINTALIKFLAFQVPRHQLESTKSEWFEAIKCRHFTSIQLSHQELLDATFYQ